MTVAVYAGTFDPITNGHLDVATRAAKLFDKVYIGVYDSPGAVRQASSGITSAGRGLLFSTQERVALVKEAVKSIPNIEVVPFAGLVVDFAKKMGAQAIVRGLRAVTDFEREFETALMNKKLCPELEVVCLMANLQYQFLSSSLLKEIASLGGDVCSMVPKHVAESLRKKLLKKK
ncbi:MAG: pantetheine-phosphate adenylyltransferase [Dehalococcoidales bacterium]|nr:pantetheine-phosphate adenylyltransferase [Dehalococcoidales bacterium]